MNTKSVVFVTGGSRGIGNAIIQKFKSAGWSTVSGATTEQITSADLSLKCDVEKAENVRKTIDTIITHFGRLDAVVNNAGIVDTENLLDINKNEDAWHKAININLHGAFYVCKYALPHLPDVSGRIVNISSVLGLIGASHATAYCTSKHGMLGLTKALAHDVAKRKITVNAICPGWVRSDMQKNRMADIGISEQDLKHSVPLGRLIEPEEVADLAFYVVTSTGASGITGQTFTIDGGAII